MLLNKNNLPERQVYNKYLCEFKIHILIAVCENRISEIFSYVRGARELFTSTIFKWQI